jgi:ribonuclease D
MSTLCPASKALLQSLSSVPGHDKYFLSVSSDAELKVQLNQLHMRVSKMLSKLVVFANPDADSVSTYNSTEDALDRIFSFLDDKLATEIHRDETPQKKAKTASAEVDHIPTGEESLTGRIVDTFTSITEHRLSQKLNASASLESSPKEFPYLPEIEESLEKSELEIDEYSRIPESIKVLLDTFDEIPSDFLFINSKKEFEDFLSAASTSEFIAIDLEHHSDFSYKGFTCLIQVTLVSTKLFSYSHFIIDPLAKPLHHQISRLNEFTTNPNKLKILHGSHQDVLWLQRDFNVYLVNSVDTFCLAGLVGSSLPGKSLKALIEHYCEISIDKQEQLADWRIRPLTAEMMAYAVNDTKYLPYIYSRMFVEILSGNGKISEETAITSYGRKTLKQGFRDSAGLAKQVFSFPAELDVQAALNKMVMRNAMRLTPDQALFLRELLKWRDFTARKANLNIGKIMSERDLLKLAPKYPFKSKLDIERIGGKVKEHVEQILEIIKKVTAAVGNEKKEVQVATNSQPISTAAAHPHFKEPRFIVQKEPVKPIRISSPQTKKDFKKSSIVEVFSTTNSKF